ncbi:hypothetical protein [Burkholderia sp. PAMC 28687]|uniref:hypothetical protein n=1 Tax=Burkholderia sp. PAMC 28687 TaxID=1795874 RepID=UPI0012D72C94|nr:hypothetical protein [Burkholderia sp. PAMC 28687]
MKLLDVRIEPKISDLKLNENGLRNYRLEVEIGEGGVHEGTVTLHLNQVSQEEDSFRYACNVTVDNSVGWGVRATQRAIDIAFDTFHAGHYAAHFDMIVDD